MKRVYTIEIMGKIRVLASTDEEALNKAYRVIERSPDEIRIVSVQVNSVNERPICDKQCGLFVAYGKQCPYKDGKYCNRDITET